MTNAFAKVVFSDLFFLFVFLPAFILLYFLASRIDARVGENRGKLSFIGRNIVLVIFSLLFYSWGEPVYVFLMILTVFVNYLCGLGIAHTRRFRKFALVLGIICDIAILGSFKYLGFFADILKDIGIPVDVPEIGLPIGISFYIFQSLSYLVDVYREESPAQSRYSDLLLYISMFPQLIAGPIVRYGSVAAEINNRHVSARDLSDGTFRFLIGLGKKVILANQFSEIVTQFLGGDLPSLQSLSTAGAWMGIIAFSLQIYFDFSGYSDMAIGIGRCLGFHFNENFNHPYVSRSASEFWRRWHISLGSFFRDYVYIPLGGNRARQWLNLLIVWMLTGLWHGASWNFVIWGLYFGFIVVVEKFTLLRWQKYIPRPLLHLYCIFIVVISWGIFYFENPDSLCAFFTVLFGQGGTPLSDFRVESALFDNFWLWITGLLFCMPVRSFVTDFASHLRPDRHSAVAFAFSVTKLVVGVAILLLSVTLLIGATNNAFLYTRF